MRERVILYSDLNNFFASVETLSHPEFKGRPMIVCGDPKERRGVVFAKNEEAKKYGIRTAETVAEAFRKCPHLITCETHFGEYKRYSRRGARDLRAVYRAHRVVQHRRVRAGRDGKRAAVRKRRRDCGKDTPRREGGIAAYGIRRRQLQQGFCEAGFGAEKARRGDGDLAGKLQGKDFPPARHRSFACGKATAEILAFARYARSAELAAADRALLVRLLGKRGAQLSVFARGEDDEARPSGRGEGGDKIHRKFHDPARDVTDREEIKRLLYALAESVSARQRDADVGKCDTVHIVVRNERMADFTCQKKVPPTALCGDVAKAAYELFCRHCPFGTRVHMLGLSVSGFDYHVEQLTLGEADGGRYEKNERAEKAVAKIREKYGYGKLQRGIMLEDERLKELDIRGRKLEHRDGEDKNGKTGK